MKKKMSLLAVLLMAVAVTAYSVSGTYAKYTSSATGTSAARVAKWGFTIEDTDETNTFTFDLFESVDDANVKEGETETIIAPGTEGFFEIDLENASEVNAEYSVEFTVDNSANIPVQFSTNGTDWTSDITELNIASESINMGASDTVKVQWKWVFNGGNDTFDTELGLDGTDEIIVTASVTATQVD